MIFAIGPQDRENPLEIDGSDGQSLEHTRENMDNTSNEVEMDEKSSTIINLHLAV